MIGKGRFAHWVASLQKISRSKSCIQETNGEFRDDLRYESNYRDGGRISDLELPKGIKLANQGHKHW